MHARTAEWVAKAESDYRIALMAAQATNPTEPDPVCFHAQQCIEKYAKAFLTEATVFFPRTHDLGDLHERCSQLDTSFGPLQNDFIALNGYAVEIRYPDDSASEAEAREAVILMTQLRTFFRAKLGLS